MTGWENARERQGLTPGSTERPCKCVLVLQSPRGCRRFHPVTSLKCMTCRDPGQVADSRLIDESGQREMAGWAEHASATVLDSH